MKISKRGVVLALGLGLAVTLAVACGSSKKDSSTSATTAPGASSPAAGAATQAAGADLAADQTFRINLGGEPDTLDPSKATFSTELTVIEQLFRGPFAYDKELKLAPDMAVAVPTKENGGISADGLTYTFKLKPNLKWSDGKPLTSKDVAFAIRRSADPRTAGDYADFMREIKGGAALAKLDAKSPAADIDNAVKAMGIETPDDSTVKLTLAAPNGVFINYLGLWIAYPLREDVIAAKGDNWIEAGNLVSSGPFTLKEWKHKDSITLERNENFYGTKPTLKTISMKMIEDAAQAFNAYKAGDLDQTGIPTAEVQSTKNDPKYKGEIVTMERLATFRAALVNSKPPFNNVDVRNAFAYAIDRKTMVDVALKGVGKPAGSFIPPGIDGYDQNLTPNYDVAKAKSLLAKAGYANGAGIPKITFTYSNVGNNPPIATFLKEQWKQNLNVDVELDPVDSKTFQAKFKAGETQIAFVGWAADYPDPENFLVPNLKSGAGNNKSGYANPAFDDLLARAQTETDRKKALPMYVDAQKLMQADSPDIFLFYSQANILRKPWVKGAVDTGMDHQVLGDRAFDKISIAKR